VAPAPAESPSKKATDDAAAKSAAPATPVSDLGETTLKKESEGGKGSISDEWIDALFTRHMCSVCKRQIHVGAFRSAPFFFFIGVENRLNQDFFFWNSPHRFVVLF